jgi:hypothetical protein
MKVCAVLTRAAFAADISCSGRFSPARRSLEEGGIMANLVGMTEAAGALAITLGQLQKLHVQQRIHEVPRLAGRRYYTAEDLARIADYVERHGVRGRGPGRPRKCRTAASA